MQKHWNAKNSPDISGSLSDDSQDELVNLGMPIISETSEYKVDSTDCFLSSTEAQPASLPDQDRTQATLDAILAILTERQAVPAAPARRRVVASPRRIEELLQIVQRCGLNPAGVVQRTDGSVEVVLSGSIPSVKAKPRGWDI